MKYRAIFVTMPHTQKGEREHIHNLGIYLSETQMKYDMCEEANK